MFITPLWMWLTSTVAHATVYDVTVCGEVDIQLIGGSSGAGDYWTNDGDDKPARGFLFTLARKLGASYVTTTIDYVADAGDEGCVTLALDSAEQYQFKFYSKAEVDGNTIEAVDNSTNQAQASATVFSNYSPTADDELTATLPGESDDRWNHLAMASFALFFENANLTGESFKLLSNEGPCCVTSGNTISLDGTINNFTLTHELGHAIATKVNGGNAAAKSCAAGWQGCNGGGDSGSSTDHGTVTKEYTSCAIVEGLGDWYSALTWNDISTSATTCEYQRGHNIDFDLDNTPDYLADIEPYPCTGTPVAGISWLDGDDWLDDATTEGAGGCTTPLQDRSTQFDFVRYAFAMRTEEDLIKQKIWDIWDDAEPHTWDVNGGGGSNDPEERWEASADSNSVGAAHDDQKHHGLDHY